MLRVGNLSIDPAVLLAPMAGITDRPFRSLVAEFGAGLVVSEMVASKEVVARCPSAQSRAEIAAGSVGTSVQIAGREPFWMAEAARVLVGQGAQIIDINMGCPARKVTNGASGSALMKEPDLALSLIEAVVNAVEVPVTLKMRLGWDDANLNAPDIAKRAEGAGIKLITIHGRTRCQFYKGSADWGAIRRAVDAVTIPVVANGDIVDLASARDALALSGAAGIMVGRATIGKPWLLAEIASGLAGTPLDLRPRGRAFADLVRRHAELHLEFYGPDVGVRAMRKHLDGYLAQVPDAALLRQELIREHDPQRVLAGLARIGELDERAWGRRAA